MISSPGTVPSKELPGTPGGSKLRHDSLPQVPTADSNAEDIEIIVEAPAECGDSAPLVNLPSTVRSSIHRLRLG